MENYNNAIIDYNKVIEFLQKEKELSELVAYAYNNRGYSWYKLNENENAINDINKSIKLLPTNSYAFKNRALVFLKKSDKENACLDLEESLKLGFTKLYGNEVKNLIHKNCKQLN
jgi:tetratricopeptide (TPR) repeat protein